MQLEIKQFLERVYGLKVAAIQTVNYEGKKKRRKTGYFLRPGYKKVQPCNPIHDLRDCSQTLLNLHLPSVLHYKLEPLCWSWMLGKLI